MEILSRQDIETNKTYINIKLTQEELKRLNEDMVVSVDERYLHCQIVAEEKALPQPLDKELEPEVELGEELKIGGVIDEVINKSQPLDDEGLREKALLTDEEIGYAVLSVAVKDQWCFRGDTLEADLPSYRAVAETATTKALALLQPKIEEARRQERERLIKWGNESCPHAKIFTTKIGVPYSTKYKRECSECWQALKGGEK